MKKGDKKLLEAYTKDFLEWINDDSYLDDYKYFSFPDGYFLLRVYLYRPKEVVENKKKIDIKGIDGKSLSTKMREVLIPYAKVIAKGPTDSDFYKNINPGDIVAVPDALGDIVKNPKYEMYREAMKERPAPEIQMPPEFIGGISKWYPSQFLMDKIGTRIDEEVYDMTFLVAQANVLAVIDKEFFERYKVKESEVIEVEA